jgi:hypothetical protein
MDVTTHILALGQTLLHCLAPLPLPFGLVASHFPTSPHKATLANLAWSTSPPMDLQSQHQLISPICKLRMVP